MDCGQCITTLYCTCYGQQQNTYENYGTHSAFELPMQSGTSGIKHHCIYRAVLNTNIYFHSQELTAT